MARSIEKLWLCVTWCYTEPQHNYLYYAQYTWAFGHWAMLNECYWHVRKYLGHTQIKFSIYFMGETSVFTKTVIDVYASYQLKAFGNNSMTWWPRWQYSWGKCAGFTSQGYNVWWENKHFNNEYSRWWKLPNLQILQWIHKEKFTGRPIRIILSTQNLLYHHCEKKQLEVAWNDDSE